MGLILLLFLVIFVIDVIKVARQVSAQRANAPKEGEAHVITEIKKECPPHKWHYQEVKDQEGNTLRWRIVCDVCGPMKPIE